VTGLRVSELAERAGVAPSTVRFYERAGLLSPARRAANGYRVFEESALDELAFVNRAKRIGMSLEDIADLVAAWPGGECRSLQARLREFLAGRIGQVREQLAELGVFERQLQTVLGRLAAGDPGPERCGTGCGCETDLDVAADGAGPGPGRGAARWPATLWPCGSASGARWPLRRRRWSVPGTLSVPATLSGWSCQRSRT
jgi:DNA-binding transcriptional MerR regulator